MFDHLTQIAATQEKFSFEQEELSAFFFPGRSSGPA